VFPVRYELDLYILFRRNTVFKGLRVTEADVDRGVMIITKHDINDKVNQFINKSQIDTLKNNPTQKNCIDKFRIANDATLLNQRTKTLIPVQYGREKDTNSYIAG
jgi:hypothetical protein